MATPSISAAGAAARRNPWPSPDVLAVFVAASAFVWFCKLHALYAADDVWTSFSVFTVACVAAVAAVREVLLLAIICLLYGSRPTVYRGHPRAIFVLGLLLLAAIALILSVDLIDAELVPRLGAPLTFSLLRYSDIFG